MTDAVSGNSGSDNTDAPRNGDDVVEAIQLYSAGLISRRTCIERVGWVKDVDEELRRIQEEEDARR